MQAKVTFSHFLFEWWIEAISIGKPYEGMLNFTTVRFLKLNLD